MPPSGSGRRRRRRRPMRPARRGLRAGAPDRRARGHHPAQRRGAAPGASRAKAQRSAARRAASRGWPGEHHAGPMPGDHLVLLARDVDGYAALARLASRGHLAGEKQFPVFERGLVTAALDEARGHLFGLLRLPQRRGAAAPAGGRAGGGAGRRAGLSTALHRRGLRRSSATTSSPTTTGSSPASSSWPTTPACRRP